MKSSIGLTATALTLIMGLNCQVLAQSDMMKRVDSRLEAATKKIQDACSADVNKFCAQVTPGEGRIILCMMAHEDKVSTKCDYTIYEVARNLDRALGRIEQTADACWPDIEKHCSNIMPGEGRVAQCLVTKKASLSKQCGSVLDKLQAE